MRLGFIYATGLLLLLIHVQSQPYVFSRKSSPKRSPRLEKVYKNKRAAALVEAYVWGRKRGVGRRLVKAHAHLNLLHLFTPSGLHFSVLAALAMMLARFIGRYGRGGPIIIYMLLYATPLLASGYYAAKRIVEYQLAKKLLRKCRIEIDSFWIFLGVFGLDFIFGTYSHSPISYCLSYLFLGIIFCLQNIPKFYWPFALLGGQILVSFCFNTPLTYVGFYFGFFLTGIFTLLFPIILLNNLLPYFNFSEFLVRIFIRAIELASDISVSSGFFYAEITLVSIVVLLGFRQRLRWTLAFLLLVTSFPIYNVPGYAYRASVRKGSDPFLEVSAVRRLFSTPLEDLVP